MAPRCSCWFPVYFLVSVTLGVIAISSAVHSSSKNSSQEVTPPIPNDVSLNASEALRRAGFTVIADLLHHKPPFFHPPNNSTIFAIKDSAITDNSSLPPWLLKNLLLYHTATSIYTMQDLLNNTTLGSCLTTLFRQKKLSVTKIDPNLRTIEINRVLISNPDIYLDSQLAVHGVLSPFASLRRQDPQSWGLDDAQPPTCRVNMNTRRNPPAQASNGYSSSSNNQSAIEWNRIVQLLGSKGYSSFSIALHSVLEGISKDSVGLTSATIFAPPDMALLGYPSTLLDRAVRLHILPKRLTYQELTLLPVRSLLRTLMPDDELEIDGVLGFLPGVVISGVEIVAPDMLTSDGFVVHGISRPFKMPELTA
ncbi:hypothetical protein HN51_043253 [Arachis hypogaea]|uniref:FAS1 domain-containing protein n=1 Tax=Arachis hypogaea TaxID=3818 RepID=A0A444Y6J9_ARAHY|nr:fasciclin-like arabinogalactan protein 21 [Arachis ipaensis]XP_025672561.1 fasciclin-like arabinogalactan protein 21 [Arachis hypogaea]QHN95400.1 Fasciclin-like arabinogalactan protein [Arachis hypogaea]RYQ97591.1 hypothetical protein Ahy_B08g093668 [Arachis hypogaea]